MYEIIKTVIQSGRYELSDMLKKTDTIWLQGGITQEQHDELAALAREHAVPENSYGSTQEQLDRIFKNLGELAAAVRANADAIAALKGESAVTPPEEWPEYVQPSGAHDAYSTGDRITYNGSHYTCQMDGCVWNPDVYPDGWKEET